MERKPLPGARNMAVDHAFLVGVQRGAPPVLRLYRWRPACLSLGRNQRGRGIYDADRAGDLGVDVVRRPTGGLAVLHDDEITYAIAAPVGALGSPRETYVAVHGALVRALRALGVDAVLRRAGGEALRPVRDAALPCFGFAAEGEVLAAGSKLVGSAQRCESRVILQHGSLPLARGAVDLASLTPVAAPASAPGRAPAARAAPDPGTTLADLLGARPDAAAVVAAVVAAFEELVGVPLVEAAPSAEERASARRLEARYASAEWTWRG